MKVVLSGSWVSMLLVFAYVDILGFWRADVIDGALDGTVPGGGVQVDESFLAPWPRCTYSCRASW